jgi:hypothetical protein
MLVATPSGDLSADEALTRDGVAWEPSVRDEERAAALVLGGLSPLEVEGLRRALDDLADRLEAQSDPMVEDLEDDDPLAPLARMIRRFLPALTAAEALGSRRRAAADGTLVTAVGMDCREAPGVRCVPLWKPPVEGTSLHRARFLEWPLAAAVVLGFGDAGTAQTARDALRDRARDDGSRLALALDRDDLSERRDEALDRVRAAAARVLGLVHRSSSRVSPASTRVLELIAGAPPRGSSVPWLRLDAEEVLVVPRLSALADLDAFEKEIEAGLGARPFEWVRRPEPIR